MSRSQRQGHLRNFLSFLFFNILRQFMECTWLKILFWIPKKVLSPPLHLLGAQSATGMKRFLNLGRFLFLEALSHFSFLVVQIFFVDLQTEQEQMHCKNFISAGACAAEHAYSTDFCLTIYLQRWPEAGK